MIDFKKQIKLFSSRIDTGSATGLVIFCLIMIVVIFILASPPEGNVTEVPKTNNTTPVSEKFDVNDMNDKIDLHIQAQYFVLQTLKAPSTAKFPALPYEVVDLEDGRYKIISYVDSQNSFGAMLRSDWSVVMKFNTDRWHPERIVVGGKVVYDPVQAKKDKEKAIADKKKLNQEIEKAQMMIDEAQKDIKSWQ